MDITELETNISIILKQLHVSCKKFSMLAGRTFLMAVEDFGLLICCIDRIDYTQVSHKITEEFADWRIMYVTTSDNMSEKRYEIIWSLMRGGYMKWLRTAFPKQTKEILLGTGNLARKIIEERLRIWGNKTRYKFYIEDNKAALKGNLLLELANDPSFFDFMPEEE